VRIDRFEDAALCVALIGYGVWYGGVIGDLTIAGGVFLAITSVWMTWLLRHQ